jgi:isochorismate synthase
MEHALSSPESPSTEAAPAFGPGPALASFALEGPRGAVLASGCRAVLDRGPLATLADRVAAFFARADASAPDVLVGALPFDPEAEDHFYQPEQWQREALTTPASAPARMRGLSLVAKPDRPAYRDLVARLLQRMAAESTSGKPLEKVVLSRSLAIETAASIDPFALYARLAGDPDVTRFLTPLPERTAGLPRHLVGATPELLVARHGDEVTSFPLAGSRPRALENGGELLMASEKERWEHRLVVEAIADALAPHCAELIVPEVPQLCTTRTMWHLGTRITGRLAKPEQMSAAALAALLHPTPAVGGTPTSAALRLIREFEPVDRGFYAGAVGWTDAAGDGDFYVSLRCADIAGASARIHAGGGIVAGSDPAGEMEETSAKFRAILDGFGIDEGGHVRQGTSE